MNAHLCNRRIRILIRSVRSQLRGNIQKALLYALLTPNEALKQLQDEGDFTALLVRQEEMKTLPFGEVWSEYCRREKVPEDGAWLEEVRRYERDVLSKRI